MKKGRNNGATGVNPGYCIKHCRTEGIGPSSFIKLIKQINQNNRFYQPEYVFCQAICKFGYTNFVNR
uniref:Uncharacterized protein n=1 Tax=Romanomermis culicivorax TaxID=13658 RepID=A0A915HN88_ROMCU